jgi:hypothetical protein
MGRQKMATKEGNTRRVNSTAGVPARRDRKRACSGEAVAVGHYYGPRLTRLAGRTLSAKPCRPRASKQTSGEHAVGRRSAGMGSDNKVQMDCLASLTVTKQQVTLSSARMIAVPLS